MDCPGLEMMRGGRFVAAAEKRIPQRGAQGRYYPGNQDPHKSLQPIRSSNSRSRLPRDQRSNTESTEIHGKENPNQLPLSVSFPGQLPPVGWGRSVVTRL